MNRIELSKNINSEDLLKLSLWKIIWFNWIITFEKGKMGDKFFFKNNFPNWGGNIFLGKNIDLYWVLANGNRLPENDLRKVYMAWCLHCWTEEWLRPFGSWIFRWRCCQCQLLTQITDGIGNKWPITAARWSSTPTPEPGLLNSFLNSLSIWNINY